jgi:small subunit ribosomal protein S9
MSLEQYYGTGRRKSSTARVYLRPGKGKFIVNRTDITQYFNRDSLKLMINQPLELLGLIKKFDILVNVKGGGKAGQAGAIRFGIARALLEFDPNL